jgi:hypothetical protein
MPDTGESNTPRTDTEFKLPQQRQTIPSAPLQRTLPDNSKRKADDAKNEADELAREFRTAEKWVIGTNVTLAVVGIIALCIYYGQLKVMQGQLGEIVRQYPEIKKSADAADNAAKAAKIAAENGGAAFHADQRGWLMTTFQSNEVAQLRDGSLWGPITIVNTGKTPILRMYGIFVLRLFDYDKTPHFEAIKKDISDLEKKTILAGRGPTSDSVAMYGGSLFPNIPRPIQVHGESVTPTEFAKYPRRAYIVLYGSIAYDDVFGHHHWTNFCSFQCNDPAQSLSDKRIKCADFNGVDSDVE